MEATDTARLDTQLKRIRVLMADHQWRTLEQIAIEVQGSQAGVSARLRELRNPDSGGYVIDKRRVPGRNGLWEYRLEPKARDTQECTTVGMSERQTL